MCFGNVVYPAYDNDEMLVGPCFQAVGFSAHTVRVGGTFVGNEVPLDQLVNQCGHSGLA